MKFVIILIGLCVFLLVLPHILKRKVPAFTDENCIRAIVGEYAKNDYYGMKLMAHAIRNRKTLKGVYGYYAKHIEKEPKDIWVTASCAWFDSLNEFDPLQGAKEWRSTMDILKGHTPRNMFIVKGYDDTFYYKPNKQEKKS